MRRFNLFSRGMTSLFKLAVRLLVIALSVSLLQQAHRLPPAPPPIPPQLDRRVMPELSAAAAPVRESSAEKPAPDWRFFVLEYHNFTDDPAQATDYTMTISGLRRDLDFLRDRGYTTILPRELAAGQLDSGAPLPQKAVLLTFDDGYESNYTLAFPLLREYGAKAAVSLITARIDEGASGFLSWDACREMAKSGLIEFASHTNDHHIRNDADGIERRDGESEEDYLARISYDLETSVTRILLETGQRATAFTYPLGRMEPWAEPFLQQHFSVTFSGVYGRARYGNSLYQLPRYNISDVHPASEYIRTS